MPRDFHGLGGRTELQLEVHRHIVVNVQNDAAPRFTLEACGLNGNPVSPGRQVADEIVAGDVGGGIEREPLLLIRHLQPRARNHRAGRVRDKPRHCARIELSSQHRREKYDKASRNDTEPTPPTFGSRHRYPPRLGFSVCTL